MILPVPTPKEWANMIIDTMHPSMGYWYCDGVRRSSKWDMVQILTASSNKRGGVTPSDPPTVAIGIPSEIEVSLRFINVRSGER